jgi:hypothetical protein
LSAVASAKAEALAKQGVFASIRGSITWFGFKTRDAKQWRGANLLQRLGWHYYPVCFLIVFL